MENNSYYRNCCYLDIYTRYLLLQTHCYCLVKINLLTTTTTLAAFSKHKTIQRMKEAANLSQQSTAHKLGKALKKTQRTNERTLAVVPTHTRYICVQRCRAGGTREKLFRPRGNDKCKIYCATIIVRIR